ncbi:MAG: DMT family transporter [Gammaproteobacteria bacterium]|nr:DMT family transporter [Gammaproteobacteria bacterium]
MAAIFRIRTPDLSLVPLSVKWTTLRSLLLASMRVAYYTALPHIKLSVAAAIYYTIPLFIILLSTLFTGDKVGLKSWFAIFLGFSGVLTIVRPNTEGFNAYVLLPLVAAIFYAVAMILTRTKCLHENAKVLSFSLNVTFIVIGLVASLVIFIWDPTESTIAVNPFLFGEWAQLDSREWSAMCVLAIIIVTGSVFAAVAYQNGPSSLVATFDYSYLAFSVLWGFLVFAEVPDLLTVIGMIMIVCAGLIAVREQKAV